MQLTPEQEAALKAAGFTEEESEQIGSLSQAVKDRRHNVRRVAIIGSGPILDAALYKMQEAGLEVMVLDDMPKNKAPFEREPFKITAGHVFEETTVIGNPASHRYRRDKKVVRNKNKSLPGKCSPKKKKRK